ncbi:serine/threonine-protein phosphatase [Sorangium sp. So ce134]
MMVCPTLAIEAGAEAPVSRCRTRNKESFGALPCLGLFLVAGGVGEEALSRTAFEMVHAVEEDSVDDACAGGMTALRCRDEVRLVMSPRRPSGCRSKSGCSGPGRYGTLASFAGVLLAPGAAYMASIGEMRVYRFRDGKLEVRMHDRAVLDGGLSDGTISPDALAILTQHAATATRALGCEAATGMKTQVERAEPRDIFLVCSGGLWGSVPEHRIAGILAAQHELRLAASLLWDCAHESGAPEQVTCLLARVAGG